MPAQGFDHIVPSESYVLGWKVDGDRVTIHVEVLLTESHPAFTPFDTKSEFGCYRVGRIVARGCSSIAGFADPESKMVWNDQTGEFKDVVEIDELAVGQDSLRMQAEELSVELLGCHEIELILDKE